jgi:ABC-2 type transport system ATP-binding protein
VDPGHVAGYDIFTQPEKIKQTIGYMSQKFSLYLDMTPFENIRFYLGIYNVALRSLGRTNRVGAGNHSVGQGAGSPNARTASGLETAPCALGCALLHQPTLLFLDEPTSGVDPITRRHFLGVHQATHGRGGDGVRITTHYMEEARHCDRVVMINAGRIVAQGRPADITRDRIPGSATGAESE